MKTKNFIFLMLLLIPIELIAQTDIVLNSSYDAYNGTILINIVNTTDKKMRILNDNGTRSYSHVLFNLKDKTGKVFSYFNAAFFETAKYQNLVFIEPRSSKTFKYLLSNLRPLTIPTEVYSVDAICYIRYSIPEKNISWQDIDKTLTIKTKQDLMIHSAYDGHNQNIMIILSNTSDYEMVVRNSGAAIRFGFLNQKGDRLATANFSFIESGAAPTTIKINPRSIVMLNYLFKDISKGIAQQSAITTVEANCSAYYDIPGKSVTNSYSQKTHTIKIK